MEAIKIVGLTKKYKELTAVEDLSLTINEGELFSLLGVNGAGKTTTIKMLSCLTKPSAGDAFLLGKSIFSEADKVKEAVEADAIAEDLKVKKAIDLVREKAAITEVEAAADAE